jgi:hypothetical protein
MIFHNPSGAPELACDACGCRWFDRMSAPGRSQALMPERVGAEACAVSGACYECGTEVSAEAQAEYGRALAVFAATRRESAPASHTDAVPVKSNL